MQPIKLPEAQITLKDKAKTCVAGWGYTKTRGEVSALLKAVDVFVVGLEECTKKWKDALPKNIICAGGYKTKKGFCKVCVFFFLNVLSHLVTFSSSLQSLIHYPTSFPSQGDSGGPLVYNGTAVGVVSFNWRGRCDYPNVPNVYTDISKYLPWIQKILKQRHC